LEVEDGATYTYHYSTNGTDVIGGSLFLGQEIFHPNSNFVIKDFNGGGNFTLLDVASHNDKYNNVVLALTSEILRLIGIRFLVQMEILA